MAAATHGETQSEVLGGGDGSRRFQRFTLKQKPLTYVAAPTASGARSTLEVRVDGIRWDEVPSLYRPRPDARVYVTRLDDEGRVTVQFGDGIHGARLPTGQENVRGHLPRRHRPRRPGRRRADQPAPHAARSACRA